MLLCLTANHQNASFDFLEKLSLGAPSAAATLADSNGILNGAVVLATCNRFEAYLDIDDDVADRALDHAIAILGQSSGVGEGALRAGVTVLTDDQAVKHLFAVSSGLESVVVGEDEISGQVRRALEAARVAGTTSSALEQLFQKATHTSRGVKSKTTLGGNGRSLVRLALDLASTRITDWSKTRVLIVGTGQYAAAVVSALRDRGVVAPRVHSPSGRGAAFAARYALHLEPALDEGIAASDVVITCTTSLVVDESVVPASGRRIIIDLGLPRNVDPGVAGLVGVELLDLETISIHAPLENLGTTSDARALVTSAAADFAADQSVEPAIVALRTHIFEILDAEIERASARGDSDGSAERALRHFAGVLLHTPSVRARELAREGHAADVVKALQALYDIGPDAPEALGKGDVESA
ncbi:MAG: glutamyl-tRNA reductase [Salinibacterium sp.]|nr:MAG: glutamyl-tRNA reductase [Salinibacterium sp.]